MCFSEVGYYELMQFLMLQPLITLEGSISYTFSTEGIHTIIVQVAAANTILQDTKAIVVKGEHLVSMAVMVPFMV